MPFGIKGTRPLRKSLALALAAALTFGAAGSVSAQSFGYATFIAHINKKGQTSRGSGVESSTRTSVGKYTVEFTREVKKCSYSATIFGNNGGQASVSHFPGDSKKLRVTTQSSSGAAKNLTFFLIVFCNY